MRKFVVALFLLMFAFGTYAEARIQFDETGRNIIKEDNFNKYENDEEFINAMRG